MDVLKFLEHPSYLCLIYFTVVNVENKVFERVIQNTDNNLYFLF